MDKENSGFSKEYDVASSTDTVSEPTKKEEEEKIEEETKYNIAKPTRRYLRGSISKNEG
jgi:hypothetical protein